MERETVQIRQLNKTVNNTMPPQRFRMPLVWRTRWSAWFAGRYLLGRKGKVRGWGACVARVSGTQASNEKHCFNSGKLFINGDKMIFNRAEKAGGVELSFGSMGLSCASRVMEFSFVLVQGKLCLGQAA